ncbi:AzlC family ABC transporter permease [Pararhizobium haloflavum]|uniref:AzlC family ABC transporter permease n=1 Tax=Pararhizobium haloflavum TaxID=2037914 RepID=UPI001FDFFA41|nr:AzlC family ABC transporter permease [Pararhizobium haloflavum]
MILPIGFFMASSSRSDFLSGIRDSVPVIVAAAPFGVLFGALAVDNGLSLFETVLMSASIYAGASQMVGIELFGGTVAPWLVVLSIFAVNFRHVLYSAAVGRRITHFTPLQKACAFFFLIDPQYAETERRAEQEKPITVAWYFGMGVPVYLFWVLEGFLGGVFGGLISEPETYGIDFLLPLYFLGLVLGFRTRRNWTPVVIASAIGSIIAFHFIGSPWHVSVGALTGIALAAVIAPPVRPGRERASQ